MIEKHHPQLSVAKQCEIVNVARSSYYNLGESPASDDAGTIDRIGKIYTKRPEYGSRRVRNILQRQGLEINRKKVQRLMRAMNIGGVCPKQKFHNGGHPHQKYPYIARDKPITRINQVWSTDITYLKTRFGTVYLVAVIDWHSRLIVSWNMSNNMSEEFCIAALESALRKGTPDIFNTDQGSQFTGEAFLSVVINNGMQPSMDGKGSATDNAPIERFWRSVKWEEVYMYEPQTYLELQCTIDKYIKFYNHERPHQALNYRTPSEVHFNLETKRFDLGGNPMYTETELKYMATW